ncbi:MAG: 5-formyltetrahydrofolate cyclo-ligase [Tannerella sp.]|jgi:5-formyltetrahydrofolate cyclo-ligase|nr:5-formyltetrahydrofolate cyclo-ligase [Tannerella sp.]
MELGESKAAWRSEMAARKQTCADDVLRRHSMRIWRRVERLPLFRQARCIACYHALPDEVQTAGFLEKWYRDKQILLPAVNGDVMTFLPYEGKNALREGAFHIMEPIRLREELPAEPAVIIVPGMAFDRQRNRLGRGKGYYDRFLSAHPAPAVGVCFQFQLFDRIPVDGHDRKMTWVVTEEETLGLATPFRV